MPLIFISNFVSENYENALSSCGFGFSYDDYDRCDGLLLPGGGDISPCLYGQTNQASKNINLKLDIFEMFLLEKFLSKNKPVLGICRGLQVINVFFGGTLKQEVRGHSGKNDVPVLCSFFGEFKKFYGEKAFVKCSHRQAVAKLGKDLNVAALSKDNVIEAVIGENIVATQFHPERSGNLSPFVIFKNKFKL